MPVRSNLRTLCRLQIGDTAQRGAAATKERGVYAASTLEVPQAVKREQGLENLSAEAA
jgi:hypothetical protein